MHVRFPARPRRRAPRFLNGALPRALAAALLAAVLALLAACGSGGRDGGDPGRSGGPAAAGFPVTVENCGVSTTYEAPPERVVTIHQHPAELMLALGLQDAMAGTAYPDSAVLPEYREAYEAIPELAAEEPSFEQVLEAEPDLVYGGYGSAFAEREGRSRQAFEDAGIATHLNREYCEDGPVTLEDAYEEIRTVGRIFGVPDRAEELVAELAGRADAAAEAVRGADPVRVFVYDSGESAPFTAGGLGLGQDLIRRAGGENVFGDLDAVFADGSWEQVVERRPDVIVIYDYGDEDGGNVARKRDFLRAHPALAGLPAVREERFVVLPLTATLVGVRAPGAVEELARALHPERFR
ncbi:ABC transporter substrate-binding protein [Streptomyces sp. DSM 44917]|uniref:ABC transporter substrate-binding protein n=1 Tax=Streptomyces boetiae TaxID=3075541 RepID=A0ABU2LC08_9ACTN|nr:ABC transporter substrate-binding protein [Streptomyces sp. DSM 44917]MDT0308842.1 ABC transporter substrate-binding protein [Streptomyces sp. DSM 44917]